MQIRHYDDNLVIIADGEKNNGTPVFLMDTTSIVKEDLNKGFEWKYTFIAYFYQQGEVDTSKPNLFELWALKNSAYYRTSNDIKDTSKSSVPPEAKRMQLGVELTKNIMANIFDFAFKDD